MNYIYLQTNSQDQLRRILNNNSNILITYLFEIMNVEFLNSNWNKSVEICRLNKIKFGDNFLVLVDMLPK